MRIFSVILLICICGAAIVDSASRRRLILIDKAESAGGDGLDWKGVTSNAPTWWVDSSYFNELGTADNTGVNFIPDLSGNGNNMHGSTSFDKYRTNVNDGGYLTRTGATLGPSTNGAQKRIFQTNSIGLITNGSMAVRLKTSGGNLGVLQTATGPDVFAYAQIFGGGLYFDWGVISPGRINKAYPADFLNTWYNIIYVATGTNISIWLHGTNFVSGPTTNTLTSSPGNTSWIYDLYILTNKRALAWNYALSTNEIAALDNWLTTNTP